ncbi:MAG: AAC(3) family N-acetyltransferase [Chloroflexi bacterium]|nr:AAC(3) family N-acetyltransferase [Chloroflexota bacterium]
MVPSFSTGYGIPGYSVPPPLKLRPKRNGTDYQHFSERMGGIERIYSVDTNDIEPGLGAIPKAVVERSGRIRGDHALNSFAAVGPEARTLIAAQRQGDVYAPLARMGELGGNVVLLGVGLTSMTLLHLAESQAGRRRFVRWANDSSGRPAAWDTGSCSEGFGRFEPVLAGLACETFVGSSRWRAYPAKETAEIAAGLSGLSPKSRVARIRCACAVLMRSRAGRWTMSVNGGTSAAAVIGDCVQR